MKNILRFLLIIVLVYMLVYLTIVIYLSIGHINFDGEVEFYITDDIHLSQTSRYMVSLGGKFGIKPFVYKIGWNDKYIVAMQYGLKYRDDFSGYKVPDKTKVNYYIIDLYEEKLIGPLSLEEFNQYDCSSIKMKKTTT